MSFFSKTTEYALRAVLYIASQSQKGVRVGVKEIAENINSPEHFLAKILQKLSRHAVILTIKGPNGGFYLTQNELNKPISDVIVALEGDQLFTGCGMGLSYCSDENPCPLHDDFKMVRNQLTIMLRGTNIGSFNDGLLNGNFTLNK